jgi:CRISPR-associated protein Csb2
MTQLHISVRFLAGQYHGEEWPPAPARLVQALIGAGRMGANREGWTAKEEEALRWLEKLEPPKIQSISAERAAAYNLFVPDNESDVAARQSIDGGRFDLSKFRTRKIVTPRLTAGPKEKPDVIYTWSAKDQSEIYRHAPVLRKLAEKLYALGWGIDMACAEADVSAQPPADLAQTFAPSETDSGNPLRIPAPGFADDVLRSWDSFRGRITAHGVNPYTKADSYAIQHYRRASELPERAYAAFRLETLDGEGFSWPWSDAPIVAAWLRHAAAEALREEGVDEATIASEVLGHAEEGNGPRISYAPVPTIGHPYSDGAVRRALLVESFGMNGELAGLLQLKLASRVLTEVGKRRCRARLIESKPGDAVLSNYTREAEIWTSVTPVILHGYNTSHRKLSQSKTERLLLQAFRNSGYPESLIREITFRPACSWAGPGSAISMRVPAHLAQWPRYHVWVRFTDVVRGPVLAGIGRHYGLGLFAAGRNRRI